MRFCRICRDEYRVKAHTVGIYDGGRLKFVRFLGLDGKDYFVSLRCIDADRTGLYEWVIDPEPPSSHPDMIV
jgi:hypothetical protein